MDAISELEYSDEELSEPTLTGDRSVCSGSLDNMVDFPISYFLSNVFYILFWASYSFI
jgi:hypothetical protein